MKKILLTLLILCSVNIFSQEKGIGLNIQITHESEITDNGSGEITLEDTTMEWGGSFYYFKDETTEYEGSILYGSINSTNGVSEISQTFWGFAGGVNFHILKGTHLQSGIGGKLSLTTYLEPKRTPPMNYESYYKGSLALELPIFLDVEMHEKFLVRFSAVAAGVVYHFSHQDDGEEKETLYNLNFYTTTTSSTKDINWFPVTICFIYKF